MKNFLQPGDSVDVDAPNDVTSGEGVVIGSLFGVATATKLSGERVALGVKGVYSLPKLSANVMAVGIKVNFNNANKELQIATSTLDNVATVLKAAGNGVTEVEVRLTPV